RRCAPRPGAGDRPDRHSAIAHPDQYLRRRADDRETVKVEVIEEGRGIDTPERAIESEGWQGEVGFEALRQHRLENVAGRDVVLGPEHHRLVLIGRGVRTRIADGGRLAIASDL